MIKPWSISTTVRDPERILPFVSTLAEMEGEKFDQAGQVKFQTLLIKNKLYKPNGLSAELIGLYNSPVLSMSYSEAEQIYDHMLSRSTELTNDPGLRGRTSAAPLTKMGLAIARNSAGPVLITNLGKAFIEGSIDIGDVYFRFFLKWQIPTPGSRDFTDTNIYDIKPFIGTLQLIDKVNSLASISGLPVKGISKAEFGVFAHTLVRSKDIDAYAREIIRIRKLTLNTKPAEARKLFKEQTKQFASKFLGTTDPKKLDGLLHNLNDYGDNSSQYFRLTRYLYIRGGGYYIDLEPRRSTEITELLKMSASSDYFETEDAYNSYMADATEPVLAWETKDKLGQIYTGVLGEILEYKNKLGIKSSLKDIDLESISAESLKTEIIRARDIRRELQERLNHKQAESQDSLSEYIDKLLNIYNLEDRPVQLEKYASLGLHALNDAILIKPNYPVGDDNQPTFTAPANVPDIECYYESANTICEVTMLTSRDQYYNEGQPVMRHLRDFEDKNDSKPAYCVFIAPKIHRDTVNTYWMATKYDYEGVRQKIVPLTIRSFINILQTLSSLRDQNKKFVHSDLIDIYKQISDLPKSLTDSTVWLETIPEVINNWSNQLIGSN
jgi:hypothetical protein